MLVLIPEKTRQLGRLRHRNEDLREIGCENVDWIHLAVGRVLW
jgi:hypothetical protein